MEAVLDENGVLEYIQNDTLKPIASDEKQLAQWKKDTTKSRRIILEGVRGHVLSRLHGKNNT